MQGRPVDETVGVGQDSVMLCGITVLHLEKSSWSPSWRMWFTQYLVKGSARLLHTQQEYRAARFAKEQGHDSLLLELSLPE